MKSQWVITIHSIFPWNPIESHIPSPLNHHFPSAFTIGLPLRHQAQRRPIGAPGSPQRHRSARGKVFLDRLSPHSANQKSFDRTAGDRESKALGHGWAMEIRNSMVHDATCYEVRTALWSYNCYNLLITVITPIWNVLFVISLATFGHGW